MRVAIVSAVAVLAVLLVALPAGADVSAGLAKWGSVCVGQISAYSRELYGFEEATATLGVAKGKKQLTINGAVTFNDETAWSLAGGYGIFLTDHLLLGARLALSDTGDSDTTGYAGARLEYTLGQKRTVPYLFGGGGVFINSPATGDDEGAWEAGGGIKVFSKPDAFWFIEARAFDYGDGTKEDVAVGLGFLY